MDFDTVLDIDTPINQVSRKLVRTTAMFGEDQVEAVERMVGGKRGPGNRAFAGMMRVVIDIGLKTIESREGGRKGKTPRTAAKHIRGAATTAASQE